MGILGMMLAFLVLCGIGLLFCNTIKVNIGEGILLSASAIVLLLFLSGKMGSFRYGFFALCALALLGVLLTALRAAAGRKRSPAAAGETGSCPAVGRKRPPAAAGETDIRASLCSPYLIGLFLVFVYCMIAYYHDFIQHIDELHLWALAVKYMERENALPTEFALYSAQNPFGTSLFHLFFQLFSGYSEQNMYVSAGILMWIGFLLPFAGGKKADWKRAAAYGLILYIALFSIYHYGMKNLYVDLPVIGWAGGLAAWWRVREKKKSDLLVAGSGLIMIWFFKWMAGPLMALLTLLFMVTHTLILEKDVLAPEKRKRTLSVCLALFLAGAAIFSVFAFLKAPGLLRALTKDKAFRTVGIFLTSAMGRPLATASALKLAFIPFLVLILVLMRAASDLFGQKKEFWTYAGYLAVTAVGYCAVLLYAYLFIFSYEESVKLSGGPRYFALAADYLFVIALAWLCQGKSKTHPKVPGYLLAGLLLLFLSGVNQKFVATMTALDKTRTTGYEDITDTKKQAERIQKLLSADDRVYLLEQKGDEEYITNTALYYLEQQVSSYLTAPWKFTKKGSITRLAERKEPSISDFPQLLADGGYTYVWVANTDAYLSEELPKVLECEDEIKSGRLYEVVYEDGAAVGLARVF